LKKLKKIEKIKKIKKIKKIIKTLNNIYILIDTNEKSMAYIFNPKNMDK
jgi:hypothetical protein